MFKTYIKMEKNIKFGDTEIQKQKFRPISIRNIDINRIVVCNKVSLDKKDLNISLATKIIKN